MTNDFGEMVNDLASSIIKSDRAAYAAGYRAGAEAMRERAAKVAWEYARGLRQPSGTSGQQGDDISQAIRALPLDPPEET